MLRAVLGFFLLSQAFAQPTAVTPPKPPITSSGPPRPPGPDVEGQVGLAGEESITVGSQFAQRQPRWATGTLIGTVPAVRGTTPLANRPGVLGNRFLDPNFLRGEESKPAPGEEDEARQLESRGELIIIETYAELRQAAQMFGGGAVAFSTGKAKLSTELNTFLKQARQRVLMTDAFKGKLVNNAVKRIQEIEGWQTKGWVPINHGWYADGENNYRVPSSYTTQTLTNSLMARDALDWIFEAAIPEILDAAMKAERGETNGIARILDGIAKLGGKIANRTVAGLAGGPWGAVVGAIQGAAEAALKAAFQGIIDASKKIETENTLYNKVVLALADMEELAGGGVEFPIQELGFSMDIPNQSVPRHLEIPAPINSFIQRSAIQFVPGAWGGQGVYPGVGLWVYRDLFQTTPFALNKDGSDDMSYTAWHRNPAYTGGKVAP